MTELLGDQAYPSVNANTNIGLVCNLVQTPAIVNRRWRWLWLIFWVPIKSLWVRRQQTFYLVEFDVWAPIPRRHIISLLKPEACLVTNINLAHVVNFERQAKKRGVSSANLIADETARLAALATEVLYLPAPQRDLLEKFIKPSPAEIIWVGDETDKYEVDPNSSRFVIGPHKFEFSQPQPEAFAQQLHYLIAISQHLKLDLGRNWFDLDFAPGRSRGLRGMRGCRLIDSSYNSNPASLKAIIAMVATIKMTPKWLVLGDYIELGDISDLAHRQLADILTAAGFEKIFFFGRRLETITYPHLKDRPDFKADINVFSDQLELINAIQSQIKGTELILIKGAGFLENVVENLLANPADIDKLCRQNASFKRFRKNFLGKRKNDS